VRQTCQIRADVVSPRAREGSVRPSKSAHPGGRTATFAVSARPPSKRTHCYRMTGTSQSRPRQRRQSPQQLRHHRLPARVLPQLTSASTGASHWRSSLARARSRPRPRLPPSHFEPSGSDTSPASADSVRRMATDRPRIRRQVINHHPSAFCNACLHYPICGVRIAWAFVDGKQVG
jgi:hypothetical protein